MSQTRKSAFFEYLDNKAQDPAQRTISELAAALRNLMAVTKDENPTPCELEAAYRQAQQAIDNMVG